MDTPSRTAHSIFDANDTPPPSPSGYVLGTTAETTVTVKVDIDGASYNVAAEVDNRFAPANATWKALLKPHAAGGNVTITASCEHCANTTAFTIYDLTFGDIFICSGQVGAARAGGPGDRAGRRLCSLGSGRRRGVRHRGA